MISGYVGIILIVGSNEEIIRLSESDVILLLHFYFLGYKVQLCFLPHFLKFFSNFVISASNYNQYMNFRLNLIIKPINFLFFCTSDWSINLDNCPIKVILEVKLKLFIISCILPSSLFTIYFFLARKQCHPFLVFVLSSK